MHYDFHPYAEVFWGNLNQVKSYCVILQWRATT